jgi:pilus assembly protein Flp/PilA
MTRAPRRRLAADESGATAIEYALLASLIAGVLIGIVASVGQTVGGLFDNAETELLEHMEEPE